MVAIRTILQGKRYLNSELEAKLFDQMFDENKVNEVQRLIERLTKREKEIFERIGSGKSTKDIANALHISLRTVESLKENIKKKLGTYSMHEVLESAIEWTKIKSI